MTSRYSRSVFTCALAIAMNTGQALSASAADGTIKVAFWNIMSGKGVDALSGHATPFHNVPNCTDPTQPLNAWGVGASQVELARVIDASTIALGLAESWDNVCGSSENVRQFLGWKSHSSSKNGVALVARHGFAGPEQWLQLDTTLNTSPGDTMWVLRQLVCVDAACTQSIPVYVTHWYGTGSYGATTYASQAQQTVAFLNATSNGLPHVIIGDFNVWEGSAKVCNQNPVNGALGYMRSAGYLDAWLTLQGSAEGYTGMANRAGCGFPEGNTWKRIDYVWSLPTFQPIDIQRFAVTPAGDASASDHYGIIATFPNPFADTASAPEPAPAPAPEPTPAPAPAPATTSVWTSAVNAVVTGTSVQKTAGCSSCFDAGAIGTQPVTAGGFFTFSVAAGHRLYAGLGSDLTANTAYAIDYAFSFNKNGVWEIREKNVYKKEGVYTATDQFTVAVDGTAVKYYKNNTLVYTSLTAATAPLVVDTSLSSIGATVVNLTPAPTPTPTAPPAPSATDVIWTSLVRSAATGTSLQKTSGCGSCFDAGAVSQQQIGAAGSVSFTVSAGNRQYVGLGRDLTASTSYAIDYAFSFNTNGVFEVREGNVYRKEGSYTAADVFKIAVDAGIVTYYKNGVLVYTSTVLATSPLAVDSSMSTIGATVSNVVLK
jgi:hypothetical protein